MDITTVEFLGVGVWSCFIGFSSFALGKLENRKNELTRLIDETIDELTQLFENSVSYYTLPTDHEDVQKSHLLIPLKIQSLVSRINRVRPVFSETRFPIEYETPLRKSYREITGDDFNTTGRQPLDLDKARDRCSSIMQIIQNLKDRKAEINSGNPLKRYSIDH